MGAHQPHTPHQQATNGEWVWGTQKASQTAQEVELTALAPCCAGLRPRRWVQQAAAPSGSVGDVVTRPNALLGFLVPPVLRVLSALWQGYHVGAHQHSLWPGLIKELPD